MMIVIIIAGRLSPVAIETGHSAMDMNMAISPTCSPLRARIWERPEAVNADLVSADRSDESPSKVVFRNSFVPDDSWLR